MCRNKHEQTSKQHKNKKLQKLPRTKYTKLDKHGIKKLRKTRWNTARQLHVHDTTPYPIRKKPPYFYP